MTARVGIDARRNPWAHSSGREYPPGFMDESLGILRRIALVQTNPRLEPAHCETIARALTAADAECARRYASRDHAGGAEAVSTI